MKLLLVVAHPDDESFGCGSLLAHATASGVESVVVCATRGELGEVSDAVAEQAGDEPGWLGAVREAELRVATQMLGVKRVELLDWLDSGVDGEPATGSLAAADPAEVTRAVAAFVDEIRPDVVVTLDASDGHRDHAAIRDATLAAVEGAAHTPRTYLYCLPRSLMAAFTGSPDYGTPDDDITTVIDTREHLDLRWRSMRAHASQVPPYVAMSPELQDAFLQSDRLLRVVPSWPGGPVESDWVSSSIE